VRHKPFRFSDTLLQRLALAWTRRRIAALCFLLPFLPFSLAQIIICTPPPATQGQTKSLLSVRPGTREDFVPFVPRPSSHLSYSFLSFLPAYRPRTSFLYLHTYLGCIANCHLPSATDITRCYVFLIGIHPTPNICNLVQHTYRWWLGIYGI
jgi:hypothetical protein